MAWDGAKISNTNMASCGTHVIGSNVKCVGCTSCISDTLHHMFVYKITIHSFIRFLEEQRMSLVPRITCIFTTPRKEKWAHDRKITSCEF